MSGSYTPSEEMLNRVEMCIKAHGPITSIGVIERLGIHTATAQKCIKKLRARSDSVLYINHWHKTEKATIAAYSHGVGDDAPKPPPSWKDNRKINEAKSKLRAANKNAVQSLITMWG